MRGDGDGWTRCDAGHEHWGRHGAAGLLLRAPAPDGAPHVLLQHRIGWSHHGGTWGVPGGARDSDESATQAALREAGEETSLDAGRLRERGCHRDDHGHWAYETVVADADALLPTVRQGESIELRWVPEGAVASLPLHPGFAGSWPLLIARPVVVLVDAANVVGARPDGWWRDRPGATSQLLDRLRALVRSTVRLPAGDYGWVSRLVAVVESEAAAVPERPPVEVLRTGRAAGSASGDDVLARAAGTLVGEVVAVTADRGLRDRLPPGTAAAGPRWLLDLLDADAAARRP